MTATETISANAATGIGERRPRVSIGMPVRNGERHIGEAIESILAQIYTDFELIISDNASTDGTERICRDFAARDSRVRYSRLEENVGAAANFNRVVELARGELFKWAAHDDMLAPAFLERCVAALDDAGEDAVLCFSQRAYIDVDGARLQAGVVLSKNKADRLGAYDDISFARLIRQRASRFPMFVFGLTRFSALRKTRLMGAYIAADLVVVAELRLVGRFIEVPEPLFFQRIYGRAPERRERLRKRGQALWFDPWSRQGRFSPGVRLFVEHWRAIWRAPISPLRKLTHTPALLGFVGIRACRLVSHWAWSAWSWLTLGAMRSRTGLRLRIWALFVALRKGDGRVAVAALSAPWLRPNRRVLQFAADRVAQRAEPEAQRLLVDWVTGADVNRRAAAAHALAKRPDALHKFAARLIGVDVASLDGAIAQAIDGASREGDPASRVNRAISESARRPQTNEPSSRYTRR